jgi:hypothetical protein
LGLTIHDIFLDHSRTCEVDEEGDCCAVSVSFGLPQLVGALEASAHRAGAGGSRRRGERQCPYFFVGCVVGRCSVTVQGCEKADHSAGLRNADRQRL